MDAESCLRREFGATLIDVRIKGLALVVALGAGGCHASVNANVKAGGSATEEQNLDEGSPEPGTSKPLVGDSDAEKPAAKAALLGARHDLHIAASAKQPTCTCVAAAVGAPDSPSFTWEAGAPALDPSSQEVVALTSEGIKCDAETPKDTLGASYWGYKVEGNDVVVIVENARFGRPITGGAIIPKPQPGGHVYLQPASKSVPYGRPLSGGGQRCQLQ